MRVPHQLLILCSIGLAGWSISQALPERAPAFDASNPLAAARAANQPIDGQALDAVALSAGAMGGTEDEQASDTDQLVQEPARTGSRRTVRRPSFESNAKYRQRFSMLQAFREAIGPAYKSTVEILHDETLQAMGAVVDAEGWIVTKDSQLPTKGKLVCRLWNGEESVAQVHSRNSAMDLALLHIERRGLQPIVWAEDELPLRGSWVATTSTQDTPAAFGVVSTGLMSVSPRRARMGVKLREDGGAVIEKVYFGTGAEIAGLRSGDRIRTIDGQVLGSQKETLNFLQSCLAGQCLNLVVQRGTDEVETQVKMMDLSEDLSDETEMEVNGMVSARSSGFDKIFMHDTVLQPNQCGGPLVNLDGRTVGMNIARAGRVSSYALPTSVLRPQVEQMLSSAKSSQVLTTRASGQ